MPNSLSVAAEERPEVREAVVIDAGVRLLFVVLRPGRTLDDGLRAAIHAGLRAQGPAHRMPDAIYAAPELPRTLDGSRHEAVLQQIFAGATIGRETVANPESLRHFVDLFNNL